MTVSFAWKLRGDSTIRFELPVLLLLRSFVSHRWRHFAAVAASTFSPSLSFTTIANEGYKTWWASAAAECGTESSLVTRGTPCPPPPSTTYPPAFPVYWLCFRIAAKGTPDGKFPHYIRCKLRWRRDAFALHVFTILLGLWYDNKLRRCFNCSAVI